MRPPEEIRDLLKQSKASFSSEKDSKILNVALSAYKRTQKEKSTLYEPNIRRLIFWRKAGYIAAAFLIVVSLAACFVLSGKVAELKNELAQRDAAIARTDDPAIINFYLREHQDVVARTASMESSTPQPARIPVSRHDIMYYEILDEQPEYMRPGIIVRGPFSQRQVGSPKIPAISNGHTLTLPEAKEAADFDLVSPIWLHPGYKLGQIRRIEGRDALQLLYTDGINSVSLFEQPLDGLRGLEPQDFREYAVYCNKGQAGGTILAWRDDALSYVLISNIEMSQLMDMAQSISAGK